MNNTPCLRRVPKLCVHLKFLRINVFDETWSRRATSISTTISFPFPVSPFFPSFFLFYPPLPLLSSRFSSMCCMRTSACHSVSILVLMRYVNARPNAIEGVCVRIHHRRDADLSRKTPVSRCVRAHSRALDAYRVDIGSRPSRYASRAMNLPRGFSLRMYLLGYLLNAHVLIYVDITPCLPVRQKRNC